MEIKLLEATMDRFVKGEMASGGPSEYSTLKPQYSEQVRQTLFVHYIE